MKILGTMPPQESQEFDFGYLQLKEHAGKTFKEVFGKKFKDLGSLLESSITGDCIFNEDGLLQGSTSFALALIREGSLLPENTFLYSPQDFARAFNKAPEVFKNFYQDLGLAITASPDQAREMTAQIEKLAQDVYDLGFKEASPESPIYIPHTALTPAFHKLTPVFGLNEEVDPQRASAYAKDGNFEKYDEKISLPISLEKGAHNIYGVPISPGAFRVCSFSGQSALASGGGLSSSVSGGRVVIGSNVPRK